jgi:hypothetical protein
MASLVAWVRVNEKARLRVVEVEADGHEALMDALEVTEVPSLVLVGREGVLGRHEGLATGRQIESLIRPHVSS